MSHSNLPVSLKIDISSIAELQQLSKTLANSELVPKDYRGKPDNILVGIMFGNELGLSPLQALQNVANINGRPSIWGDAALGLVRASGQLQEFTEWFEVEGKREEDSEKILNAIRGNKSVVAKCQSSRKGFTAKTTSFSWAEARHAKLDQKENTPWQNYPSRMMQMRARGANLRDQFTEVLKGLAIAEEMQGTDIDLVESTPGHFAPEASQGPVSKQEEKAQSIKEKLKGVAPAASTQAQEEPKPEATPEPAEAKPEKSGDDLTDEDKIQVLINEAEALGYSKDKLIEDVKKNFLRPSRSISDLNAAMKKVSGFKLSEEQRAEVIRAFNAMSKILSRFNG